LIAPGVILASSCLATATQVAAQTAPPVQGTIAPDDTTRKVYAAGHVVIVGVLDGVDHAVEFAKNLFAGKPPAVDPLSGLREGTTVVVREARGMSAPRGGSREADNGLMATEGMVTAIDRLRKNVTVRFDDGKKEALRLAEHQPADAGKELDAAGLAEGLVALSYPDDKGERIDRLFTKAK
jgi:hypothetical protein